MKNILVQTTYPKAKTQDTYLILLEVKNVWCYYTLN